MHTHKLGHSSSLPRHTISPAQIDAFTKLHFRFKSCRLSVFNFYMFFFCICAAVFVFFFIVVILTSYGSYSRAQMRYGLLEIKYGVIKIIVNMKLWPGGQ